MPDLSLAISIADSLAKEMDRTSDRILRIEASRDWPLSRAMQAYVDSGKRLRLCIRRPFKADTFAPIKLTDNPATATRWRNDTRRDYDIVIVGATGGPLDSGLKDVRRIDRRTLIARWEASTVEQLPDSSEVGKPEAKRLLAELFEMVSSGNIQASGLEKFITHVLAHPTVAQICESLWMLGLAPDPRGMDAGMARRRILKNLELVTHLRTSDDPMVDRVLANAAKGANTSVAHVANAAIAFRGTSDLTKLKGVALPILEGLFLRAPTTQGARTTGLSELLNYSKDHRKEVQAALKELSDSWDMTSPQEAIEGRFAAGEILATTKVDLSPSVSEASDNEGEGAIELAFPWTRPTDGVQILAATSSSSLPEQLNAGHGKFTAADLRGMGHAASQVEAFLAAREALGRYEPWLERDAQALFLLCEPALTAAEQYLRTWTELAQAASTAKDARAFVEAVQVLETVSGPSASPEWILLGPLHPFRLDPLVRAIRQCRDHLHSGSDIAELGGALEWTLDKSFPAYPTIHRQDKTLYLATDASHVVYTKSVDTNLPPVREAGGLDRLFAAIDSFSPWLQDGISLLVIDPPFGGGVAKALENLRRRMSGRPVTVYHLATNDHTDPLDRFEGTLRYLPKVSHLSSATELPQVNVLLRFAPATAGVGEPYTSDWKATRGTHLALRLEESLDGPFASRPTTKVKIDPREGNTVVRLTHSLYEAFTGGQPIHATLRPLLETDDAPALSRMARNTDWVIFAAPGPLGLVAPRTINSTLRYVGRSNMGSYGLYAYVADDMFPVRRHFERSFERTPMATVSPARMVDMLVDKAQESSDAVLFSSLSRVPAQVGVLVALQIAKENAASDEISFTLSLDDLGWTRSWLTKGTRADFIVITLRSTSEVVFDVIESKSKESGEKIACDPQSAVFAEGIAQVRHTLSVLSEIVAATTATLDQDLRFTSLIEQLMAAAMSRAAELDEAKRRKAIQVINALSRREATVFLRGTVVATQPGVNSPRERKAADDQVSIVWAGNPDVEATFGLPAGFTMTASAVSSGESESGVRARMQDGLAEPVSVQAEGPVAEPNDTQDQAEASSARLVLPQSQVADMARAFIVAARIHGVAISEAEPVYLQVGPSVVVAGVRLREGSKVRELQNRIEDIARDAGLGEVSKSIVVENDVEPRTIRLILPRTDREFPPLPTKPLKERSSNGGYIPLCIGQTIDGRDYTSDLESWPHLLIAGTSGSGKTTFVKSLLKQMASHGARRLKTLIVDGKGETDYFGIVPAEMFPPTFPDIQLGPQFALESLKWAVEEMEARRKAIVDLARRNPSPQPLKATDLYRIALEERRVPDVVPLVVIIDEFADIMLGNKRDADEFESLVQRIAQVGRSRLLHLVLATQRPDKETVRGAIKANLNSRAVFRLPTQADSITVLGRAGAEGLLLHGDMLFQCGTTEAERLQGYAC